MCRMLANLGLSRKRNGASHNFLASVTALSNEFLELNRSVLGGGKNKVLTEDDILEVAAKVDSTSSAKTGSIRRLDRRSK